MTVVDTLTEAGINARPMHTHEADSLDVFLLGVDREVPKGRITIYEPRGRRAPTVKVSADPTHRQAVINVTEATRTMTREINSGTTKERDSIWLRRHCGVALPDNTTFKITSSRKKQRTYPHRRVPRTILYDWMLTVTATIPASKQSFLVGIDETTHFVAQLPRVAATVASAHKILRPKDVPEGSLRQGEWFFVPATKKELIEIERQVTMGRVFAKALEASGSEYQRNVSFHYAHQMVEIGNVKFVTGIVRDRRSMTSARNVRRQVEVEPRHRTLVLTDWHRVARNTEKVSDQTTTRQQQRQYWD